VTLALLFSGGLYAYALWRFPNDPGLAGISGFDAEAAAAQVAIFAFVLVLGYFRVPADPERNLVIRIVRRVLPVTPRFHGPRFVVRQDGRIWATPLLVALLCLEASDVFFAVDSVPAIFAPTREPFVVFTSNIFAILGLRSILAARAGLAADRAVAGGRCHPVRHESTAACRHPSRGRRRASRRPTATRMPKMMASGRGGQPGM
jgi:hypothetical protein